MSDCQRPNRPESLPPEHIPRVEELQTVSVLFKQLSDASRLRIFWLYATVRSAERNWRIWWR